MSKKNKNIISYATVIILSITVLPALVAPTIAKNIKCPIPTLEYPTSRYELGAALFKNGLLASSFKLQTTKPVTSSSLRFYTSESSAHSGTLVLDANFPELYGDNQARLILKPEHQITFDSLYQGAGFWMKAPRYTSVFFIMKDGAGNKFTIGAHRQTRDDWQFVATPVKATRKYVNKKPKGTIKMPVTWVGLLIQDYSNSNRGLWRHVHAQLRDFQKVALPQSHHQQLSIQLDPSPFAHVFQPGESVKATFSAKEGAIRWRLQDYKRHIIAKGHGTKTVQVSHKFKKPGYYEFIIQLWRNNRRVDMRKLSLAAIKPATTMPSNIGIQTHIGRESWNNNDTIKLLSILGVNNIRFGFPRKRFMKDGKLVMQSRTKDFLKLARENNIHVIGVVRQTIPKTPDEYKDWAKYVGFVADNTRGVINLFGFWNEWTHHHGLNGGKDYAKIIRSAAKVMRKRAPKASLIALSGETPFGNGAEYLLKSIHDLGASKVVDGISVHMYRADRVPERGAWAIDNLNVLVNKLAKLCKKYDVKPNVYVTETGYTTARIPAGVSEHEQARFLVRTFALFCSAPNLKKVYWYELHDEKVPLRGDVKTDIDYIQRHFGIFRYPSFGYAPKPAAVAMAVFDRQTAGGKFSELRRFGVGKRLFSIRVTFPDNRPDCVILWSQGYLPSLADKPVGDKVVSIQGQDITVTRLMGTTHALTSNTITLSPNPIYLKGKNIQISLAQ